MKRLLLFALFITTLLAPVAAEKVKIGKLYYDLDWDKRTAEVTYFPRETYDDALPPNTIVSASIYTYPSGNNVSGSLTIPETVTYKNTTFVVVSIGNDAFDRCRKLTSVTIPNSVTSIGNGAFADCSKMTYVTIPYSVRSIGKNVFEGCDKLRLVNIGNPVLDMNYNVFPKLVEINVFYTWKDFNDRLLTWEQYYQQNKKATMTLSSVEEIQNAVNKEIEAWQKKSEFESTAEWQQRVNEKTRQEKINSLSKVYIDRYNIEKKNVEAEQQQLMQSYEQYKKEKLDEYYEMKALAEAYNFRSTDFKLSPYDADNNTFLISSSTYGDILLPVAREDAPAFKDNWETIKRNVRPEYVPNGETVALNKIIFSSGGKDYVYDSHTQGKYSVTDIDYNFKPVEIADISLADLNIGGSLPQQEVSSKVVSKSASESLTPRKVEAGQNRIAATERSDVDYAIPQVASDKNSTTYAVIIANENYQTLSKVPYAINDGEVLEKYLTSAVGLPKNHVKVYKNATVGKMAEAVNYMESLAKAFGDKLNLIFYYAGHGVPDESTKNALILPVDGNPAIPKTCYAVDELIKGLGELRANNVVVLLDACFSGASRNDDMLVAARGIKLKTNDVSPVGNMVLLSATQGDETAYPFEKEGHGLFTYFLLKKLQENKGNVTLGELADYIIENVKQASIVNNGKLQTPTVTVSPSLMHSWREINLK